MSPTPLHTVTTLAKETISIWNAKKWKQCVNIERCGIDDFSYFCLCTWKTVIRLDLSWIMLKAFHVIQPPGIDSGFYKNHLYYINTD